MGVLYGRSRSIFFTGSFSLFFYYCCYQRDKFYYLFCRFLLVFVYMGLQSTLQYVLFLLTTIPPFPQTIQDKPHPFLPNYPSISTIPSLNQNSLIISTTKDGLCSYCGGDGREGGQNFLQCLQNRSLEFQGNTGMRLIFTLFLAVSLSAVLSPAELINPTVQSSPAARTLHPAHIERRDKCNLNFDEFKSKHRKKYSSVAEQNYRRGIFHANLRKLNQHNSNPARSFNMKPNSFLDVSSKEFRSLYSNTYQSNAYSRNLSQSIIQEQVKRGELEGMGDNSTRDVADQTDLNGTNEETVDAQECGEAAGGEFSKTLRKLQTLPLPKGDNFIITSKDIKSLDALTGYSTKPPKNCSKKHPINIDWSLYSGSVRYQGYCGACYAFSTVDTLAAHHAIGSFGSFVGLSVQQIVDCVDNELTYGCHGGFLEGSYTYIQMRGVALEGVYPYGAGESGQRGKCRFHGGPFRLESFHTVQEGDCRGVVKELRRGPVSAGISGYNLQFYEEGVFDECDESLDHAIVIVGFKSGKGWRIKNSWGREWGVEGYGWIAEGNTCGICNMAVAIRI